MTDILTAQVESEIREALDYFRAPKVKIGTANDYQNVRLYCRKGKKEVEAVVWGVEPEMFDHTRHYERMKRLRKLVGRAVHDLLSQGAVLA